MVLNKKGDYGIYLDGNSLAADFPYKGVGKKVACRYLTFVFYCPLHQDIETIPEDGDPYDAYIERNGEFEMLTDKLKRASLVSLIDEAYNCKDLKLLAWLKGGSWLKGSSPSLDGWLRGNRGMPPKRVFKRVPRELRGALLERIRKTRPAELAKALTFFF